MSQRLPLLCEAVKRLLSGGPIVEPSAERRAQSDEVASSSPGGATSDTDLVRLLHDLLERLGVTVRIEPMPEEAHLAGGYCVLNGQSALFLSPTASLAEQRDALIEAARAIGTEHVWMPPALRARIEAR